MTDSLERLVGNLEGQIDALQQSMAEGLESRRLIYSKVEAVDKKLVGIERDVASLKKDVAAIDECLEETIKPALEDYKKLKNRGLGMLIGAALVGGGVGTAATKLLSKFGFGS